MASVPDTLAALTARGWELAVEQLTNAEDELALVTHWFRTPGDASVNADAHFGSDARTARFLAVVVPTLIEHLEASLVSISAPWGLDGAAPRLVLVSLLPDAPATVEARMLQRVAGATTAPWWQLGQARVAPPAELLEIAARLRI
jgi:hypothetical protein